MYFISGQVCAACPSQGVPWTLIFTGVLAIAVVGLFLRMDMQKWARVASLKGVVNYTQNLALVSLIPIEYPKLYLDAMQFLTKITNLLNVETVGPECHAEWMKNWDIRTLGTLGFFWFVVLQIYVLQDNRLEWFFAHPCRVLLALPVLFPAFFAAWGSSCLFKQHFDAGAPISIMNEETDMFEPARVVSSTATSITVHIEGTSKKDTVTLNFDDERISYDLEVIAKSDCERRHATEVGRKQDRARGNMIRIHYTDDQGDDLEGREAYNNPDEWLVVGDERIVTDLPAFVRGKLLSNKGDRMTLLLLTTGYISISRLAFQTFKTSEDGTFFFDNEIKMTDTTHVAVMCAGGLTVLALTLGVPWWIRAKTRALRREGLLHDPKTRIRYNSLFDSYKTSCADFTFYALSRRGLALLATMFLPHDLPLLTALFQLVLDVVYLALIWRWRPFNAHEVVIPAKLLLRCCRCCCRRSKFRIKTSEVNNAYEMEDKLKSMGLSEEQAWILAQGADLNGDGRYDEEEIKALLLAAQKIMGGSNKSKFEDDGDGTLRVQDTFNVFEIIATVIVIANKIFGILLIPDERGGLGVTLSEGALVGLMMPVVAANVAFGVLLLFHAAVTLRDTMDVDTTDWSTAATDDVVVKLKKLQREIDEAAHAGHGGKADEVRKEFELIKASALQDTRRTRGSRGRIFNAAGEASAEFERELEEAAKARKALENRVLNNVKDDKKKPASGTKDNRKRKKLSSKKKSDKGTKKKKEKEKSSKKRKRARKKMKKIKTKLRAGSMSAADALAAVAALNHNRKKASKKKKKKSKRNVEPRAHEWPVPLDEELGVSEKEWTRLSELCDPNFICPITMELMKEPATTTTTSMQYDRAAIVKCVKKLGCDPLDPEHRLDLEDIVPSVPLRNLIVKFVILNQKGGPGGKKKKKKSSKKKKKNRRVSLDEVLAAKGPKMKGVVRKHTKKKKKKRRD